MKKGEQAPDFNLQNTDGEFISLHQSIKDTKVLLAFFPLAFSSVCTDQFCKIRDNMKMYNALNTKVIGISVDSFFTLKEFKKRNNLNFTLLSDFNKDVSTNYNVLYEDYHGMRGVSKRAIFIINKYNIVDYTEVLEESNRLPDFKRVYRVLSQK